MTEFSPENQNPQEVREGIKRVVSYFETREGEHPIIEVDEHAPGLFLFDIDGTLIDARKIHGKAVVDTYVEKFGMQFKDDEARKAFAEAWFSNFGLGDHEEHQILAKNSGIDLGEGESREKLVDELVQLYAQKMESTVADATPEERDAMLLEGVRDFLDRMKAEKIPAAIVTGNMKQSAYALLKNLDLSQYFITGGFDDDETVVQEPMRRANILRSAVEKCKEKGIEFSPDNMLVFGDTPKDFQATLYEEEGRPKTVLIATGDHRFYDLGPLESNVGQGGKPHLVLPKLSALKLDAFFDGLKELEK